MDKFKKSEFYEQLNNDALAKIYNLEKTVYRQVERRYFKNKNVCESLYEGEVNKYFSEELRIVAEDNELNFRTFHNAAYKTDEFYLETYFEKYGLDFWQLVFVSEKDKKIYVGSKPVFHLFFFEDDTEMLKKLKNESFDIKNIYVLLLKQKSKCSSRNNAIKGIADSE